MIISVNKSHLGAVWMNYAAEKLLSVWLWSFLYQAAARGLCHQLKNTTGNQTKGFYTLQISNSGPCCCACVAIWLITWQPAAAATLLSGQTAKDGRFMEAQTWLILHSHKTLTYLLCRLTGRRAVSECTVPETSSSYFWNTRQCYKSTLRLPAYHTEDSLLWGRTIHQARKKSLLRGQNVKQQKCSCNTDPQYDHLSEITHLLGLLW